MLLTAIGLLLIVIAPIAVIPFLLFFIAFNTAGAAGDLIMVINLVPLSSDTMMEDNGSGVIIYGLKENRNAGLHCVP